MARKRRKQKKSPVLEYRRLPVPELHDRMSQCDAEGDVRAAIDIAKELHRRHPTPAHKALLGEAYVSRAAQLLDKGQLAEAGAVLRHAEDLSPDNARLASLQAERGLRGGDQSAAMSVLGRMDDSPARGRAPGCVPPGR